MTKNATVRPLATYVAGDLYGEWIDADQDADDIRREITRVMVNAPCNTTCGRCGGKWGADETCEDCCDEDGNPKDGGNVPEEWAIHDYEGFEGIKLSEHEDIDTVADLAAALDEHGEAFAVWWNNENRDEVDTRAFLDAYQGTYRSLEDYAEEYLDGIGAFENCNDMLKTYFDYEKFARDLEMGGDIWTADGGDGVFVFDSH
jgi:antirestriction protein